LEQTAPLSPQESAVFTVMARNYPFNLHRKLLSHSRVRDNPTAKYANVNYAFGEPLTHSVLRCCDAAMFRWLDADADAPAPELATCHHLVATADNDA